jgi:quercetin dioxygenase-like cupin family protein
MSISRAPVALAHREGEPIWFNHDLLIFKATSGQTEGAFILFEQTSQRGKTTPLHRHPHEDETFYVVGGELIVHVDGNNHTGQPGSVISVPRGAPHAFMVTSELFRGLILFTPGNEACEAFFRTAGDPAPIHELPEPGPPDVARLTAAAEQHGVEMLGPPPFTVNVTPELEPAARQ